MSFLDVLVQAISGAMGGALAGAASREHGRRILQDVGLGAIGGAVGGFFLNGLVPVLVNGAGQPNLTSAVDDLAMRVLTGLVAGGLLALMFNLPRLLRDERNHSK